MTADVNSESPSLRRGLGREGKLETRRERATEESKIGRREISLCEAGRKSQPAPFEMTGVQYYIVQRMSSFFATRAKSLSLVARGRAEN